MLDTVLLQKLDNPVKLLTSSSTQCVRLAIAHLPVALGNVSGLLEGLSMVAHRASGNKIDNIMVVREFIIFCVIKHTTKNARFY